MPPPTSNSARKSFRSAVPANSTTTQDESKRTKRVSNRALNISQNTTVPFSQAGCSRDSDSSDSEIEVAREIGNRRSTNPQIHSQPSTSGANQANVSSSDSEIQVMHRQKKKNRIQSETSLESSDKDTHNREKARGHQNPASSTAAKNPATKKIDPRHVKVGVTKKNLAASTVPLNDSDEERMSSNTSLIGGSFKQLVNKCVRYILVADQKKHAIKKKDIMIHVFEKANQKMYPSVMGEACNVLKKTFGLEILKNKDQKSYLLVNILDRDLEVHEFVEHSPLELKKQGFILYLLTIIFMNENSIAEEDLWKALEPLGIFVNSRVSHPIFGDVKKYISVELVKQMYLEHKSASREFVWGERALQEVGKEQLLNFACEIMKDNKPEDWVYQYNDAKGKFVEEA